MNAHLHFRALYKDSEELLQGSGEQLEEVKQSGISQQGNLSLIKNALHVIVINATCVAAASILTILLPFDLRPAFTLEWSSVSSLRKHAQHYTTTDS